MGGRVAKSQKRKMLSCSAYLFGWILWTTGVVSFMTLPVRSQDESVTKLDRGARVRRGRAHLAQLRAAAASHGTNGGDVKALTPSWSSCFSYSSRLGNDGNHGVPYHYRCFVGFLSKKYFVTNLKFRYQRVKKIRKIKARLLKFIYCSLTILDLRNLHSTFDK